jgi:hypothetical protein
MRFNVGQVYERTADGRRAIVVGMRSEGREGLLRFVDTSAEEWFLWADFRQTRRMAFNWPMRLDEAPSCDEAAPELTGQVSHLASVRYWPR